MTEREINYRKKQKLENLPNKRYSKASPGFEQYYHNNNIHNYSIHKSASMVSALDDYQPKETSSLSKGQE